MIDTITARFPGYLLSALFAAGLLVAGCASTSPYTTGPVKTFDPDTTRIEQPEEAPQYQYWDRIDNTIFHQIEKPLDLNRVFRFMGETIGVSGPKQADNVNRLDEPPESSWYTYRHYYNPMTIEGIANGPNTVEPDTEGLWTIFSAKLEGANPGFFAEDANGNRFLIKFDGPNYPELTTSAEVIGTKIFYAAGYYVPESTITYFDPENVRVGDGVMVEEFGKERPMTQEDYRSIISGVPRNEDGRVRALASKFVDGVPLGPWYLEGTRSDDPNDRVNHEHRREIRGMRIISSWLNDTDRRDANTLSVYTDGGYIRHLVQDFGNTLGANGAVIHSPIHGQAYMIDPRYMVASAFTLGMVVHPWEDVDPDEFIPHPSVGYFRADSFRPGSWVSVHPIPAFENMTLRDAFWGAKQVMSFSDEDIRAIVETGRLSNEDAEEYLVQTLIERRDKIGDHWFRKINPIDKFKASRRGDQVMLRFTDLGTDNDIFEREGTTYSYLLQAEDGPVYADEKSSGEPLFTDTVPPPASAEPQVLRYEIVTNRKHVKTSGKKVVVYVVEDGSGLRIGGIDREE
ncbi:MAG: hypothetical protein GVY08_04705 [Bacteroidetes bacterium]|nr:hypothetical protein [Bacteroidota bacterium]